LYRQRRQLLGGGVVADELVVLDRARWRFLGRRDLHRHDRFGQPPRVAGGLGVLLRAQCEGVDLLAG
jgi:hypothetical protein